MTLSKDQMAEIHTMVTREPEPTRRPVVPAMEGLLFKPLDCLDEHGFIRVIDYMGDDAAIVQAARVSYGLGTKEARDDQGLINYLMRHWHTTPFEMCELKLHVKLPIFVARQWIRHRTANVNEYSARYSILDSEFHFPTEEGLRQQAKRNKQSSDGTIEPSVAKAWLQQAIEETDRNYGLYDVGLKVGIGREQARMVLPLNTYTQWYWKVDAHNLLHFLDLRTDSHAQREIQVYANMITCVVEQWLPMTFAAWSRYRRFAKTFSSGQLSCLQEFIRTRKMEKIEGVSSEEWDEVYNFIEEALAQ